MSLLASVPGTARFDAGRGCGHAGDGEHGADDGHNDGHIVQFYNDEAFLVGAVGEFLRAGTRAGEPLVMIATQPHRQAFTRWLVNDGVDVEGLTSEGLFVALDAQETLSTFLVDGVPDRDLFQEAIGGVLKRVGARSKTGRTRAYGEMVDCLWRAGHSEAAIRLETMWNDIGRQYSFSLLCAYGMDNFRHERAAGGFAAICGTHSRVVPTERYVSLGDSGSRSREISLLQQRALALKTEIEHREAVERKLRDAIKLRDDFLCVAGHELRTPLTVLRLQLAMLLSPKCGQRDPQTERRLTAVAAQTDRLTNLAERLLDVWQLGDKLTLQRRDVDLSALVHESIDAFVDVAAAADCAVAIAGDANVVGHWDPQRIQQVMQDLLSNAFKFGRGAPVHVRISALPDHAEIVVRDGGMGIATDDQAHVFDRFERRVPTQSFGGLGFGLWIARRVVVAHGGEIRVDSAPGQGATFTVTLPYGAVTPPPS
jgi:signal transduction histidine kinase